MTQELFDEQDYEANVDFESIKGEIINLLESTGRPGIGNLIKWLNSSDFFDAPASTKFHGSVKHGLALHSLNVYRSLKELCDLYKIEIDNSSLIIIGLLHDVCKINVYHIEMRNRKIDGNWVQVPEYTFKDNLPLGHGEKSVMLLQRYIPLTMTEILSINWHMGSFDNRCQAYTGQCALQDAMTRSKIVLLTHMADSIATFIKE